MNLGLVIYGSLDTLSGGYLYDRKLVEYLRAQGDSVRIISLPWRSYAAHLADNFSFHLPTGLDLLIEDELNHPSLLAANLRRRAYPVISLVHHLRSSEKRPAWQNIFYRLVETRYLRTVDGFIFNSQTTRSVVAALIGEPRPVVVAYPPTDRFGPALLPEIVSARAAQPGPLRVVFLGNIIPRKGLHTLLQAIALLKEPLHLDVIGATGSDPQYAQAMRQLSMRLGLESQVEFLGALDDQALAEKMGSSHVLAAPSSYEGFGIVYLEGMAFGLPAIATSAGAAGEIITDGEDGWLLPPGDPQALSARLAQLQGERALLARLSLNALQRYQRQPAWEQSAGDIRRFLKKFV
jgi:glycosyltransferase involved in cell wall biosynthesis